MLSDEDPQFAAAIKYPSTVQSILIKLCLPPTGEKSLAVEVLLVGKTIVLEPVVNDIVILLNKLYDDAVVVVADNTPINVGVPDKSFVVFQ